MSEDVTDIRLEEQAKGQELRLIGAINNDNLFDVLTIAYT
jgi:hypothetical protein